MELKCLDCGTCFDDPIEGSCSCFINPPCAKCTAERYCPECDSTNIDRLP